MALADFLYPRSKHSSAELCLIVSACQLSSQLSFITFAKFFLPRYLRIEERPLTWQTKTCSTTNLTRHDFHIMVSTSFVCHLFPRFSLPYQPLSTSCTQLLGLDGHAVCAQHFSLLSEFLFANKAQLHATCSPADTVHACQKGCFEWFGIAISLLPTVWEPKLADHTMSPTTI